MFSLSSVSLGIFTKMISKPDNPSGTVTGDNDKSTEGEMLAERIRQVIVESGLSPAEISRRLGVTRAAVSGWCNGSVKNVRAKHLYALAKLTGIRAEWISLGTGAKYQADEPDKPEPAGGDMHLDYVSNRERDLLQIFRRLPQEAQEMLIATGTAFKMQVETAQKNVVALPKKSQK